MTPLDLARNLSRSDALGDRALGVAIVARSLADDDGLRTGWPMAAAIPAAIRYLSLSPTAALIVESTALAPTVSDAMLNRRSDR